MEANELGAVQGLAIDRALALHTSQPVGALVFDDAADPGIDGEFFGAEVFLALDAALDDPAVDITFLAGIGEGHRSTIGFRTGSVDQAGCIALDDGPPFATAGTVVPTLLDAKLPVSMQQHRRI